MSSLESSPSELNKTLEIDQHIMVHNTLKNLGVALHQDVFIKL